jgi:hypothetical protein
MRIPTRLIVAAAAALGVMVTVVGVILLAAPDLAAALYGLPRAPEPVWQRVAGIRELTIGVLILALVVTKQLRPLGYLMLALAPIPVCDFILALAHDQGPVAFQHAPGGPGMIALGLLLLKRAQS